MRLVPISRRKLVQRLRLLGFEGPFSATRHEYMIRGAQKVFIPNPHGADIAVPLLKRLLIEFNITEEEWDKKE